MKQLIYFFFIFNFITFTISANSHYYNIKPLPKNVSGWFGPSNQIILKELLNKHKPKLLVELGAWLGASTIYLAQLMPENSILYSVDTWLGSKEHNEMPEFKNTLRNLYQQFLSNIIHMNLTSKVIPIRMNTLEAAEALDISPDFIYVDADHAAEAVFNDIMSWYKKLAKGGIICGDDWVWLGVIQGVYKARELLNQKLNTYGNVWYFDPKP